MLARLTGIVMVALALLAVAAQGQSPADEAALGASFPQVPRLSPEVRLAVQLPGEGRVEAVAELLVDGRVRAGTTAATRHTVEARPDLVIRFRAAHRRAVQDGARTLRAAVRLRVTLTATMAGRPAVLRRTVESPVRVAPDFDGGLRLPDVGPGISRRAAVAVDLPDAFDQVHGAMAGTPAVGTFRGRVQGCAMTVGVDATASRARPREVRTATRAVRVLRAPKALPGTRPWVVVRVLIDAAAATPSRCARREGPAILRRAMRSAAVRLTGPQPGPGFAVA
ncbi:hypothetical protein [Conexibacter sp. SYSU D00693]|uniref:hypothetical protein n=1 Tax=Conexibacter sp. SYSU D00693 TaxID=2812560 RepID=UPI00196A6231|nr:hypothetical protein [Conexibacter sp. SYSU D00693]